MDSSYSRRKFKEHQEEDLQDLINEKLEEICEEFPEHSVSTLKRRMTVKSLDKIKRAEETVVEKALKKVEDYLQINSSKIDAKYKEIEKMSAVLDMEKVEGIINTRCLALGRSIGRNDALVHKSIAETDRFVRHALRDMDAKLERLKGN